METIEVILVEWLIQLTVIIIMMSSFYLLIRFLMDRHFKRIEDKMYRKTMFEFERQADRLEREFDMKFDTRFKEKNKEK